MKLPKCVQWLLKKFYIAEQTNKPMDKAELLAALQKEVSTYNKIIATDKGDWIVKGFIDIYKKVYTISIDTKVVSKVLELLLIPAFHIFAEKNNLILELPPQQNSYPDLTFICKETGNKFAVDIKSTVKDSNNKIKSMTLGAFTGYFRTKDSTKNILYPYHSYQGHLVLGVIYSQNKTKSSETKIYDIEDLDKIESVIKDFQFFVQEKYKIASATPGSGNTKNIGSTNDIDTLINGKGIFAELGEDVYNDYWSFYMTKEMASTAKMDQPYSNLKNYLEYKKKGLEVLKENEEKINKFSEQESAIEEENATEGTETEDEG